jgi:hypothetical protein
MNKMKEVTQGQGAAVVATADLHVNSEIVGSDDGGFGVVERLIQPSNNKIALCMVLFYIVFV